MPRILSIILFCHPQQIGIIFPLGHQMATVVQDLLCSCTKPPLKSRGVGRRWRRQWHPTPVLLPGKSHGWRSLVGCSPWGSDESDMTERLLSLFTFLHWRRKWQPTPVFLPGESQGRGSLVGCCLWGRTESDTTEAT